MQAQACDFLKVNGPFYGHNFDGRFGKLMSPSILNTRFNKLVRNPVKNEVNFNCISIIDFSQNGTYS